MSTYYEKGYERGRAAGSWLVDGNTDEGTLRAILAGFDDGDPAILDACPDPLSGEWAGESIPELFDIPIGGEWPADDDLTEYEDGFRDGFWDQAIADVRGFLGESTNV